MADEGNVEAPAGSETPPAPEAAPLIDGEGNLREGWTSVLPEDLRGESFLKETKTLEGMARSAVSARKMVGKDKLPIPTEATSEADWDIWHAAGGRPEKSADYNFVRPEGMPEEVYSQDRAQAYMDAFHKLGLSTPQATAIFDMHNAEVMEHVTKSAQEAELSMTELKDGLVKDWGNAYEQRKHLGNLAVNEGVKTEEEGFKDRLLEKFGNDPDFIRFSSNLGAKFAEGGPAPQELIDTPSDIQEKIDEEMANPAYGPDYAKHGFTKAQHRTQVNKVKQLFNKKMTSTAKTGR
jgi:hypothetical protein